MAAMWLRERGIDPEGDLCTAIKTEREPWITSTPMSKAIFAGELDVCRFLWAHGAASTIRTKNSYGVTPIHSSCCCGNLDIAKWLFDVGAANDIRVANNSGWTPMLSACQKGFFNVAKWLHKVGAAEDIRTPTIYGHTPMEFACGAGHLEVVTWLILKGAANNNTKGHVKAATLLKAVPLYRRPLLRASLRFLVSENAMFMSLVLTAMHFQQSEPRYCSTFLRANTAPRCVLPLLRGYEDSVMRHIADLAGVVYGRELRNAREAIHIWNTFEVESAKRAARKVEALSRVDARPE